MLIVLHSLSLLSTRMTPPPITHPLKYQSRLRKAIVAVSCALPGSDTTNISITFHGFLQLTKQQSLAENKQQKQVAESIKEEHANPPHQSEQSEQLDAANKFNRLLYEMVNLKAEEASSDGAYQEE